MRAPDAVDGPSRYDRIGTTYARYRRADARIAAQIERAVSGARTVLDVGSGTGSYEPRHRRVTAVEPSSLMIAQRRHGAAPVVRAVAERLPFPDGTFDVALAVLTIHHWTDAAVGLAEMARVARRQVVLTWDPEVYARFWLLRDYVPQIIEGEGDFPTVGFVREQLRVDRVEIVPVPWDCTDGFCAAYWRRPEVYLDAGARAAISGFARCDEEVVEAAIARLAGDLSDGSWVRRNGDLLGLEEADFGYRLVVANGLRV